MEKRSRRRTRDLVTQPASQGLSENEIGCARISMMARSTNAPCKGRIQMRKTNPLHLLTFGLQRTAGPYRWPGRQTLHARARYRCARPFASIYSHSACNARPVHTVASKGDLKALKCDFRYTPDCVAKVENRTTPKISQKLIFRRLYHCNAL